MSVTNENLRTSDDKHSPRDFGTASQLFTQHNNKTINVELLPFVVAEGRKMSEPEDDLVILDEIRALENILAADEASEPSGVSKDLPHLHNLTNANRRVNCYSRGFGEVTPYHEQENVSNSGNETVSSEQSALEVNRKLIALLREAKRDLMGMLEKCMENKAIVDERIRERAKNAANTRKIHIGCAGMPYFKDAKHFIQPRNEDALTKTANGELQVVHLHSTVQWSPSDRNILWRAIRQEVAAAVLRKEQRDGVATPTVAGTEDIDNLPVTKKFNLPKNFKTMVGPIGAMEFDWLKIAAMYFDNKHTPEECRVMWRVFLHPNINRYRWSTEEDANIDRLSKKYNHQDWDTVANELGTNRSGYQCFIRYNTNNQTVCIKESAWTIEEDKRLKLCIEKLKIGHYIPWGVVSKYIEGRSKMQTYFRWKYNAAPHLKKGRFTPEEDETLLKAVKQHGENFAKISCSTMPHRSSVQLSEHYHLLRQRERGGLRNSWTINDDTRILRLYKKYGADWSMIAKKFPEKTRTQLRHRHRSILKSSSKGYSLYEIPRVTNVTEAPMKTNSQIDKEIAMVERERVETVHSKYCKEILQVDVDLIKYFTPIQPAAGRPGRKQKYYKDQELQHVTRKLYVLLETLNADLAIPADLDDQNLSEKDRQLLVSFQRYREAQIAKTQNESIKYLRVFDEEDAVREVHFTPLCPGDCNKHEKVRFNDTIDYEKPEFLDCQATLEMRMQTPAIVVDLVGQDTSEEFDLLAKYLITPKNAGAVRKIYVLGPEICSKVVPAPPESCQTQDEAWMMKKRRRANRNQWWDSCISGGIIYNPDWSVDCVEPNYHTLLGLKHIMAVDVAVEKSVVDPTTMSQEAKKSMRILKERLVQLFKFPIGLSNVHRPEIYTKAVQPETVESPPMPPPAKRKRLAKKNSKRVGKQ